MEQHKASAGTSTSSKKKQDDVGEKAAQPVSKQQIKGNGTRKVNNTTSQEGEPHSGGT
jgi:hypothetical protein